MDYKAKTADSNGRIDIMEISGGSAAEVGDLLRRQGFLPLSIEEKPFRPGEYFSYEKINAALFRYNRAAYLIEFSRLLALLIKSGMPVGEAFRVLSDKKGEAGYFDKIIEDVKNSIQTGIPLSIALSMRSDFFDDLYIRSVASGETSGNLAPILLNLCSYYQKTQAFKKKLISAALYPALVLVLSTFGMIYLFAKIVPTYTKLFSDMNAELPAISQFVFFIADVISRFYMQFLLLSGVFAFVAVRWLRAFENRETVDSFLLKIPLVNQFIYKKSHSIFYRTCGLLISSGINVLNALEIGSSIVTNKVLSDQLNAALTSIKEGNSISYALENTGFACDIVPKLIKTGEESGSLDGIFNNIADNSESELDTLTTTIEALFGPMILILVLSVFAVVVVAILLPMITAATVVS